MDYSEPTARFYFVTLEDSARFYFVTLEDFYLWMDWKNRILSLRPSFSFIKALHIHREYNSQADSLSKQGLSGQLGLFQVEEFDEGSLFSAFSISLF